MPATKEKQLFKHELKLIRQWRKVADCSDSALELVKILETAMRERGGMKKLTYQRKKKTVTEWVEITGIPYKVILSRLEKNWPVKRALETPYVASPPLKTIRFKGETLTCKQWAEKSGIAETVIRTRYYQKGWTASRTLTEPVNFTKKG